MSAPKIDDGTVEIHGKVYKTVARRLGEFWHDYPAYRIACDVLDWGDIVRIKASITDEAGNVVATGHAEEIRGATNILKTSAVETCETSAIGRALGVLGLGGTAIASAEEMELALQQQADDTATGYLIKHNEAVRDYIDHIVSIKQYLAAGDWGLAYEAFAELDPDVVKALWVAPTKGGIFTTGERQQMKSNEWNNARKFHHNIQDDE
jgi:hypothetical protein